MALKVVPENQQFIDALPQALQSEVLDRLEALMKLSNPVPWQQVDAQLQLIKVIAASPFSVQIFLLNPQLLDHA